MGLLHWIKQILTVNKINYFLKELLYLPNFCFIVVDCRLSTMADHQQSYSRQKQTFVYKLLTLHIHPPKKHADAAIFSNSSWLRQSETLPRWHPILAPPTFCVQVLALIIKLAGSVFLKQS